MRGRFVSAKSYISYHSIFHSIKDSGGPIQATIGNQCIFNIIGLTSYGSTYCGAKNSPGIYTRVTSYLGWIEAKVWTS